MIIPITEANKGVSFCSHHNLSPAGGLLLSVLNLAQSSNQSKRHAAQDGDDDFNDPTLPLEMICQTRQK